MPASAQAPDSIEAEIAAAVETIAVSDRHCEATLTVDGRRYRAWRAHYLPVTDNVPDGFWHGNFTDRAEAVQAAEDGIRAYFAGDDTDCMIAPAWRPCPPPLTAPADALDGGTAGFARAMRETNHPPV